MIEFKAECGHTVRAKDDDAGGVVRCSYCGKPATVPDGRNDDLDFLFDDVEQQESRLSPRSRRRRERAARPSRRRPSSAPFNPFPIVLRMGYAAALICIVFFVGKKYVLPLFAEGGVSDRAALQANKTTRQPRKGASPSTSASMGGLIANRDPVGLYVGSTPPGALVYCVEESEAPRRGRIPEGPGCTQTTANRERLHLKDGAYVVDVVLRLNDGRLYDPARPYFQGYRAFRHAIVEASDDDRIQLLESYFVPDEADVVFVDEDDEQIFLVRRYLNVQVHNKRSKGIRALFLPRIGSKDRDGFSLAELVTHYIPKTKAYSFDEAYVRNELDFYHVPASEHLFIVQALSAIGVIPYVTPDGRTLLFKIGIDDGTFATPTIREATR